MKNRPLVVLLALSVGATLVAVFFAFDPARYPFPRCPINLLTGLYCPGCGSQRATHALLHGHVAQAADLNLLAVLSLPLLALGAVATLRTLLSGQLHRPALLYRSWLPLVLAGTVAVFTVLRNLPGSLGAWLAP